MNLSNGVKVTRSLSGVAAGTSDQNGATLDMAGFEGVLFIALLGALTATQVTAIHAQQDSDAAMGSPADLEGASVGPLADADSGKCLVLDIYRPRERYVRCVVDRATANAVIDGVIAIQYGGRRAGQGHGANVAAAEITASPAEGTA